MTRFNSSVRRPVSWSRFLIFALAAFAGLSWLASGRAQLPVDPTHNSVLVVYDAGVEVGQVFRDVAGPQYVEHWVLFPNYRFDQGGNPGASIEIVAEPGPGYRSVRDFLARVPFPPGSRYVVAACQEYDRLP